MVHEHATPTFAMAVPPTVRPPRWTLAKRLSMLFVGLLALVITSFGVFAYRVVREGAVQRSSERLVSVAGELAVTSARSSAARAALLTSLVRATALDTALASSAVPDSVALTRRLVAQRAIGDSTWLAVEAWDAAGHRRTRAAAHARDSIIMRRVMDEALRTTKVSRSPAYARDGQVRFWNAVPVMQGTRVVGALLEQRRIAANTAVEGLLARLTGMDLRVFITTRGSTEWASLLGSPITSPLGGSASLDAMPDSVAKWIDTDVAEPVLVAAASVTGTPWRIVVVQTQAAMLARPQQMLVEFLLVGFVCLAAGAIAALWLSEMETRPIADLRRAATAVAGGDYAQRVVPSGVEETAALAEAFNRMAAQVSSVLATLARRNTDLQHANEAKSRFLAVMSHELRTPLNAISGHAELLSLGVYGDVTEEQRGALERIGRNKDQLMALVTDILHYARQEANPVPVVSEPVSVTRQFAAMHETVSEQFERKAVQLVVDDTGAWITADALRVQQVLINLVTNALQFTPAGGTVTVSAEESGESVVLRVSDTGVGIAADAQVAIFEPFVQVDNSLTRRAGGAGLGLSIVRQLVTAMGGTVRVESIEGEGATFEVTLPMCAPQPEIAPWPVGVLTAQF